MSDIDEFEGTDVPSPGYAVLLQQDIDILDVRYFGSNESAANRYYQRNRKNAFEGWLVKVIAYTPISTSAGEF